jgi:DNA processing protein
MSSGRGRRDAARRSRRRAKPDPAMRAVMRALGHDPADVETLAARVRLPIPAVVAALTSLELDGRAASLPGGIWQRVG